MAQADGFVINDDGAFISLSNYNDNKITCLFTTTLDKVFDVQVDEDILKEIKSIPNVTFEFFTNNDESSLGIRYIISKSY